MKELVREWLAPHACAVGTGCHCGCESEALPGFSQEHGSPSLITHGMSPVTGDFHVPSPITSLVSCFAGEGRLGGRWPVSPHKLPPASVKWREGQKMRLSAPDPVFLLATQCQLRPQEACLPQPSPCLVFDGRFAAYPSAIWLSPAPATRSCFLTQGWGHCASPTAGLQQPGPQQPGCESWEERGHCEGLGGGGGLGLRSFMQHSLQPLLTELSASSVWPGGDGVWGAQRARTPVGGPPLVVSIQRGQWVPQSLRGPGLASSCCTVGTHPQGRCGTLPPAGGMGHRPRHCPGHRPQSRGQKTSPCWMEGGREIRPGMFCLIFDSLF